MKILLIQPPVSFKEKAFAFIPDCPHLGLLYLANSLMKRGHEVDYLDISDNSLSLEDVRRKVNSRIDVVGITAMTQNIKGAVQLAKYVRENKCKVKIIIGGPHISADPELINRYPYFDTAITGEAEITFPKVVKDNLKGIIRGETPQNLDYYSPARKLVNYSVYKKRGLVSNALFATRGCPHHCNFCSIPAIDKKVRFHSPGKIVDEIQECIRLNGIRLFTFIDDALTIKKEFVFSLCEFIMRLPYKIKWEAQSRINYVDRPLLKTMKRAGCERLLFGIESGNERIRNQIIGKGITDKQIMDATKLCWQEGIEPDHYLMIGQPTETIKEIMDTVNCSLRFKPNIIGVFLTMPLPGSPLFDQARNEGVIDKDVIDRFICGEYGQGYEGCYPYYIPKGLKLSDLLQARQMSYKKFYFRPSYVLNRLKRDLFSWQKIKRDVMEGLSLLIKGRSINDFIREIDY